MDHATSQDKKLLGYADVAAALALPLNSSRRLVRALGINLGQRGWFLPSGTMAKLVAGEIQLRMAAPPSKKKPTKAVNRTGSPTVAAGPAKRKVG